MPHRLSGAQGPLERVADAFEEAMEESKSLREQMHKMISELRMEMEGKLRDGMIQHASATREDVEDKIGPLLERLKAFEERIDDLLETSLPGAVLEQLKIIRLEEAEEKKLKWEERKRAWMRWGFPFSILTAILLFVAAASEAFYALRGDSSPQDVRDSSRAASQLEQLLEELTNQP